ncbi:MAG TPA: CocE/NonD family hydrolase, partial [Streptosporangiaceae bacterium]
MAFGSRVLGAILHAPPALTRDVDVQRDVAVPAPDGTSLLTDLYLARSREPLPTVLIRSPYGRRAIHGLSARMFAERGYHAVVQSTRGTFGSGGQLDFDSEAADGRAAADWIVDQDWSNGEIAGFG